MPKYIVNGKTYNIPDDKVEGFERKYPDANVEYSNDGKTYHIPINKREGFLKQYPNAVAGSFDQPIQLTQQESAPITSAPQPNDEEYIKGFGAGVKQGTQQLGAGLKYAGGEALDAVSRTAKDNADALSALEQMQAEGKDVAEETKTDAKSVLLPLLGHSGTTIDMVTRLFGKKNPIANANAEVATDRTIRRALKETNGDVEAAKALLAERANEQTTADVWREEAAQKMNEAKPTKGFGAWVGNMVPQMAGTLAGLGLSAVTKSPVPAQVLGLGQMGALTASTAGASMKEARDAGATNGEVWATGLADAVIEFATEAIPFKGYLSPLVKQLKSRTGKTIADAVIDKKSPARKELQGLLDKANAQLGGKLFTAENAAKYIDDIAREGFSELTAEVLQTITPMIYAEPENYPTLWEVVNNGIEGLKGGIFMGAILGGASNAATNKAQRDRRKQQGFVDVAEVKFSDEQNDTGIAEVLSYDPKTNQASVLFEGEIIPIDNASENIINSHRFTFDEFDRGQIDMEQAESYDNGRSLETPQEKNDAYNMYEYQTQNMRRIFGLDEDADVDAFIGDDPLAFAMARRNENPDDGQAVLDYLNAKATHDGMLDTINDKIDETIAQSNATIDSRVNKSDGLVHPATLKLNDRKVYIISGNVATLEDGTVDTESSDESVIVKDAENGESEFVDPASIFRVDDVLDPEMEKMATAETITSTITDQAEKDIEGILSFNAGEAYPILDDQGVEHTATIVSDNGDGTVLLLMDNEAQPTTATKEIIQQMSEAYNINRTAKIVEAKGVMDQQSIVDKNSNQADMQPEQIVEETQPAPRIPADEQGEPIYEMAPIHETWSAILEMNEGNEEEAIDTANIMRENAQAELDKAMKGSKAKGKTVSQIQAAKAEQKALIKQAQDKLNYWTDVANYRDAQIELMKRAEQRVNIAKAQQASQEKGRYSEENATLGAPIDFRDYVMRAIATGGIRFIRKDSATGTRGLGSHTGLKSNEERNARIWLLNNENGLYPEEAAEQLLTSYAEELGYVPNIDTMDALSEIIDVVGSYSTPSSMFEAAQVRHAEITEQNIEQEAEDAQARVLSTIAESLGLTLDEYLAGEEMMYAETLPAFEADYEQITAIFVEAAQQEEILNQNNDERSTENADVQSGVHSEGGLSDGSQAGAGVLQGTQVDNSIADSRGAEAGQGSDAQVVEPSIDDIPASEVSGGAEIIGENNWGKIYQWVKGKAVEGANLLKSLKNGYLKGVFYRREIGDIDLFWGNDKVGLSHIINKHIIKQNDFVGIEQAINSISDVIENGEIGTQEDGRVIISKDNYKVVIERTLEGNWIVTAYDKTRPQKEKRRSKSDATRLHQDIFDKENGELVSPRSASSESKDTTTEPQKQEVEQKNDDHRIVFGAFGKDYISQDGKNTFRITQIDGAKRVANVNVNTEAVGADNIEMTFEEVANLFRNGQWVEASTPQMQGADIVTINKDKHTKTGEDLYVAKIKDRVSRDEYNRIKGIAKENNGYYSTTKRGFIFKTEADAETFRLATQIPSERAENTKDVSLAELRDVGSATNDIVEPATSKSTEPQWEYEHQTELDQLVSREGKPFEFNEELEKAKAQYKEYSELMRKEMEEKEAKYAEMDASVEAAQSLAEAEEDSDYRDRVVSYDQQFADLQAEYDALDKNDADALNEWREKKTSVVRDYLSHIKNRFGMRGELIVFNGANEEQIQQAYQQLIASYEVNGNTNPPTYEAFKEKSLRKNVVGTYRKGGNAISFNATADDAQNRKMQFAETMFHENAHRVSDNLYSDKEFESIWAGAKKSKDSITKMVNELYEGRNDVTKGKEYIAKAIGYLANKQKDSFMQFLRGKMPVEGLLKKLRSKSEIAKLAVEETLNIIKDEYRVQLSRRGDTRGMGGVGYGSDLQDSGMVLQGDGRSEQGRRADNAERGLRGRVLTAATDLAASLDVKLNVVDAIPNAPKSVKGRYNINTDSVDFVLLNATSVEDAKQTVLHEVVAHKGLRDVVGRDHFEEFLGKVFRAADTDTRRKIVALAAQNGWDFNVATEEYLAGLAEEGFDSRENRTFLQKVRDLFMDMLSAAKIALGFNINENDMRYMLWRTYQMQRRQGAMAVAEDVVMQQKWGVGNFRNRPMTEAEQIIADAKANGTYLKAPNGKDTNLTPEQWVTVRTDAFKKWFGNWENDPANASKVVDANGEPKVVYNGSKVQHYNYDGRLRTKGQSATNSKVSFFTDNKAVAERYGKFVNEVFLNIRNPYEIDYNGAGWQGWSGAADGKQRASTDSYADLLANGAVDSTLERIIENYGRAEADYLASGSVRNEGVAPDGVIAYEVADPMRSTLYIVRNAEAKDISRNSVTPKGVETFTNLGKSSLLFDSQIKSATDNVGTFNPSDDDIRYRVAPSIPSTGEARRLYDDAVRHYTKVDKTKEKAKSLWHHLREAYQDSMLSVQKLMDAVLTETGNTLRSSDDVYKAENQLSSKNKAEIEKWERDFMKPLQMEILNLVKKGASYDDIVEYLMAKHGLERNLVFSHRDDEENGKVWDGIVKRDYSGLTELTGEAEYFTEAAQQIVDEFEGKYNADKLWSKINAATKESLRKSYDSGLMSKETYDKVSTMFKYYVPLRGWDSNVAADQYEYMGNKGMKILPVLKTAKGRTSRADDPIATLGSVGESSIIQGNRNLMKLKFLNFAQNNPTSLLTVSEQWYEQNADGTWRPSNPEIPENASADEVDALIKEHEAKMEALGDKATKKRQGLNINLHTTKWEQEEHTVNVKRNGKEYKIFVNGNPIAAQAINGFTNPNANKKDSWEWIEQRATAVKNFMARAFTSMNPAFIFTNLARDLVWAGTSVAIKENAAYARQYTKNISEAMAKAQLPRLVSKWKSGTLDMNVPIEKFFNEFITNGGETGFTQLNTVDDYKRNMERFIKEAQGGATTNFKKGWRWIWDNVEFLNRSAEDTTRFIVYLTSRQMGRSITESVANAKDITVNFNKKGRGTMGANVLGFAYIFFNATIQSLANFGKLLANHPKKTAAALTTFASSGMIAPMVALSLQAMLSGDDDEPTYWDLPEWVRRNNIIIYVGGSGYVTIPLPHELRPFYGMGELAFSTLMGKEEPETAIRKAAEGFASLMPFDYTGNAGNAIVNFTPTIAQPLVQLVVNKDYFGTPIYRKTAFNEMDPEWTKAYKSTNQYLVDATEFVNELTGGDEVKTGIIDLNPAVIEHLFEGYLGGVAKTINRTAKTLSMFWDEDARVWRNVPVLSSFYNEADERTSGSQVNREYFAATNEADEVEHLYSGYKKRAKMGSMEYAEKLNELVNSDVFKRYQTVNSYQKAVSKLNTALKDADNTDREEIETLIMELKVDMLEELDALNNK